MGTITVEKQITFMRGDTNYYNYTFPSINIPSGETFSSFRITGSWTTNLDISMPASPWTGMAFNTDYTDRNLIGCGSSWSNPQLRARNRAGTTATVTITITVTTVSSAHSITLTHGAGGAAAISKTSALPGETVIVQSTPTTGNTANTPTASGVIFYVSSANVWTFTMPAHDVAISCT